ncbi:MAG TPA: bifunctional serine/threonine-protein kinase/formylglycine-generating enzyme family protein [Planctomycetota bacterium]
MSVKTWGDFEVYFDRPLGRGGMGAVYLGRQISLDRPAAVKLLKKDLTENPEFVTRFHREASLLARLVDAHVVQVFGAGEADGSHFYAMEFVEGEDLAAKLKKGHPFSVDEVLQVALSVGLALQAAWRHRIIHRDIKPSNILITEDRQIKVMDFGLAKASDSDLTQSEVIMGTAKYMSPEQATGGDLDIRSDLYSLGVVLYELATGKPPFMGETPTAIMYQHVHQAPMPPRQINRKLPVDVEGLILRLLAKDPRTRYPTPEAVVSTVRGILDGVTPDERSTLYNETLLLATPTPAPQEPTATAPPVPRSSAAPLMLTLTAGLLLAGGGAYYYFVEGGGKPAPPPKPPAAMRKPPEDPPRPPADPPAPPPADPARPAAWEAPLKKGLDAFARREWTAAVSLLEEAGRLGAADVKDKILQAKANDLILRGDEETDDERAIERFDAARKLVPSEEADRKFARASYRRWSKLAESREGGDWNQAAVDWGRALPFAEDGLKAEIEARRQFCRLYAEGVRARTGEDWKTAHERFRELAKDPRGFSSSIDLELKRAKEEVDKLAALARVELKKEFDRALEEGRAACARAAWAEARSAFARAGELRFAGMSREPVAALMKDVEAALAAAPGMVYVPGGAFRMGGGRDVEGPEDGEVRVAAFYLDERETSAGEYRDFLKALGDAGGHHPGCAKDEPAGKSHAPADIDEQKADEPVVNVDWWDAASYAAWKKKRLPRESEWERAAGFDPAGRRPYPWGEKWRKEGGRSFLGLSGMGDGAIEWTSDWFQKYPWSGTSNIDFGEKKKALRGGVLLAGDAERDARTSFRHWNLPSYRSGKVGFRCARDVAERATEDR